MVTEFYPVLYSLWYNCDIAVQKLSIHGVSYTTYNRKVVGSSLAGPTFSLAIYFRGMSHYLGIICLLENCISYCQQHRKTNIYKKSFACLIRNYFGIFKGLQKICGNILSVSWQGRPECASIDKLNDILMNSSKFFKPIFDAYSILERFWWLRLYSKW